MASKAILSKTFGGKKTNLKSYCSMYEMRPTFLGERVLCSGAGIWKPCPDLNKCKTNKMVVAIYRKKKEDVFEGIADHLSGH